MGIIKEKAGAFGRRWGKSGNMKSENLEALGDGQDEGWKTVEG